MKKTLIVFSLFLAFGMASLMGQKYNTRTGTVKFIAESALNDAKAENHQVRVVYDAATQDLAYSVLIKSFEFEKALMQTHFNADMESEEFTKATFLGKITTPAKLDVTKEGKYDITISGDLTIHGKVKKVEEKGTLTVKGGKLQIQGKFYINCKDFGISPRAGVQEKVEITVDGTLDPAA